MADAWWGIAKEPSASGSGVAVAAEGVVNAVEVSKRNRPLRPGVRGGCRAQARDELGEE